MKTVAEVIGVSRSNLVERLFLATTSGIRGEDVRDLV